MKEIPTVGTRAGVVELFKAGDETTMRAALSSAAPVPRFYGSEVLRHTPDAIDLSRAAQGLPLTVGHSERDPTSAALPVGLVTGVKLDTRDAKLRGDLSFDTDDESEAVRGKVARGFANLSVTYRILEHEGPDQSGLVTATRWMPLAVSIVSMPADSTVGVGRSLELTQEAIMPEVTSTPEADEASPTSVIEQVKTRSGAGFKAGQEAERTRINDIRAEAGSLARAIPDLHADIEALAEHASGDPTITPDKFRALALELIGGAGHPLQVEARSDGVQIGAARMPSSASGEAAPRDRFGAFAAPGSAHRGMVQPGADEREKAGAGIVNAMLQKCGVEVDDKDMAGNQFRGYSIIDQAEHMLRVNGIETRGLTREQIAKQAIKMPTHARAISLGTANYDTTDFPAVTEAVITKLVFEGFMAADITWSEWCSVGSAPDFKAFTIPQLSSVSSLPIVAENIAYTDLTLLDSKEGGTLVKRGGLLSLSWESMVNDDQSMFARNATRMGEAAARTVDEQVYAYLVTNAAMNDTVALFHATHNNLGANAMDLTGLIATRVAIGRQVDANSVPLGIRLARVIVPLELEDAARGLANTEWLPIWNDTGTAEIAGSRQFNTVRGTFEITSTARLSDAIDWYGVARMGQALEVVFLNGQQAPTIERDQGWDTDAIHHKVRSVFAVVAPDFRGMFFNDNT